jgi:hypothetical protein
VGAWRSGGAVEFQGGGGSPTIGGGFLVFLPHEEEEGELRLRGGSTRKWPTDGAHRREKLGSGGSSDSDAGGVLWRTGVDNGLHLG